MTNCETDCKCARNASFSGWPRIGVTGGREREKKDEPHKKADQIRSLLLLAQNRGLIASSERHYETNFFIVLRAKGGFSNRKATHCVIHSHSEEIQEKNNSPQNGTENRDQDDMPKKIDGN